MRVRGRRLVLVSTVALLVGAVAPVSGPGVAADPCAVPSTNPIPCENSLPGTAPSTWDVVGAGDPGIQGFATDISVNLGGTISFKVNTSSTNYTLTIYRMGYYGGSGARQIAIVQPSAPLPQSQPACLTDSATGLIDCGNWAVSASWTVPADGVSGIYFAELSDAVSGASSHIPFVVRNDASTSDIVFKTNDPTWLAYNDYGGNNLYYGSAPSSDGRAYKVSFNRPFNDRSEVGGYGAPNYLFYAEYPMVRWLESNGYNVSYTSSVDVERNAALLRNHKVILSAGHDEYWSAGERAALTAARDAGVNIAQFTGNTGFWKTRWENSIDGSGTPFRTLVCYKETLNSTILDPQDPPVWTGTWRDARFSPPADGGRPENALNGTIFMVNRGTATPVISSDFSRLRFWRNTDVAALASGQSVTLGDSTIGYEWDEDVDNGFRPAGLFHLSSLTVSVPELLQDAGKTYVPGTAVHNLTMYRAPSGALVFGAGTVQWAWGLDITHDASDSGPLAPDHNMQQATVNLLADMGAQPATLQPNLVATPASTDTTPPTSSITFPAANGTVHTQSTVTITGTASDAGGGVVAGVEVSVDGGTTWHPATGTATWSYRWTTRGPTTVTIESRAVDDSGNLETPSAGISAHVTPPPCPCTLFPATATPATVAAPDSMALELGVKFSADSPGYINGVTFYKSSQNTGAHSGSLWSATGALLATGTFTNESASGWQTLLFPAPVAVSANTIYLASYHTNAGFYSTTSGYFAGPLDAWPMHAPSGLNGVFAYGSSQFPNQSFNATNYWVDAIFNTSFVDTVPPTLTNVSPDAGSVNVRGTAPVLATFSENVQPSSIQFTLTDPNSVPVSGTVIYNATSWTATFTPASQLASGITYTATVSGVTDLAGNVMAAPYSWSFTTGSCPCSLFPPNSAPAVASSGDLSPIELGVKFQAAVNGFVNGIRFYKGSGNTGTHVGSLWSSTGQRLATATFTGESASGWQEVSFASPVAISANTFYVASYHTDAGNYSYTVGGLSAGVDSPPLHGVASDVSPNGVFVYTAATAFPTNSFNATNYWVDLVFNTTQVDTTPPAVDRTSPAGGATGVVSSGAVSATFNKSVVQSSIQFTLTGPGNVAVAGTLSYSDTSFTASFQPSATLEAATVYTATVSGATDASGNVMTAPFSWSFTTVPCCSLFAGTSTPSTVTVNDGNSIELGMKFTSDVSGNVTGVRFYKGPQNTGTHVGSLWSSTGQLLASAAFMSETASGWQQVSFATPVSITANTVYIVAYHTDVGYYSASVGGFAVAIDNAPLHGVASSVSANGLYLYSGTSAFPTFTFNNTNYWVDLVFTRQSGAAPAVLSTSPAASATGVAASAAITATFNKSVVASSIQFSLAGPGNAPVAGVLTYDDTTFKASFQPTAALASGTVYQASVSGATDASGTAMTAPVSWSFTSAGCPCSLFDASMTPAVASSGDLSPIELGVKFKVDVSGFISGIRFYKGSGNTGTHVGSLWSSTGQRLATATFTNESASGWQQVSFAAPVAIAANTVYVASYHTDAGNYSYTAGGFSAALDNPPLHAVANGVSANGVFLYTPTSAFATDSFNATNYWVDVVFTQVDTTPPSVASTSPVATATGVATSGAITATFSKSVVASSIQFTLTGPGNTAVPGALTYDGATFRASFQPNAALAEGTVYTATVSGATDASGNVMTAPFSWSFTTRACPCSLFAASATPAVASSGDVNAIELGVKFQADVNGFVNGIRFYKGSGNTGTHVGSLWSSTGQLLASATFSNESASGWQQVSFASPVAVNANTGYVASYHTDAGNYSYTAAAFATAIDNAPLHAVANGVSANGVFLYSASSAFPTDSFNATNYWVDLVFNTARVDTTPPAVVSTSPSANATSVATGAAITATFNKSVVQSSIQFTLTGPGNTPVAGALSYNDTSFTASFQPSAALAEGTVYTATVSGATDHSGNVMTGSFAWSYTTAACPCSLFPASATPAVASSGDVNAIELGVKFQADVSGFVNGIRFYKGSGNTGTHVGSLWSSTGQLLASATFSNESASGWQQVNLASPVAVNANTGYVASYHTNAGNYSYTAAAFATAVDNAPLHGVANGASANGVFLYSASSVFPTDSFNATNYWVDLVFNTARVDTTPPVVVSTSPAANATSVATGAAITATFNKSVVQSSIQFTLTGPGNTLVAGALSYNDTSFTASFQPSGALAAGTTYTATVSGATDHSANVMTASVSWSFTTVPCCSLFAGTSTPSTVTVNDGNSIELGMKFTSDVGGTVTGVRFYKGPQNTGTHVGSLWSSTGQLLANATFSNESASGWQQVSFAAPVAITPNTIYVVSYHTSVGYYSASGGGFATAIDNAPLHGVANGASANGVFLYSASSAFPTDSFNATNYWVDVTFTGS